MLRNIYRIRVSNENCFLSRKIFRSEYWNHIYWTDSDSHILQHSIYNTGMLHVFVKHQKLFFLDGRTARVLFARFQFRVGKYHKKKPVYWHNLLVPLRETTQVTKEKKNISVLAFTRVLQASIEIEIVRTFCELEDFEIDLEIVRDRRSFVGHESIIFADQWYLNIIRYPIV